MTPHQLRARSIRSLTVVSAAWIAACSFQDFGSLQDGLSDDSGGSGGSRSSGGAKNSDGGTSSGGGSSGGNQGGTGGDATGGESSGDGGSMGGMGGAEPNPVVVLNASFESANLTGWDVDPPDAVGYRYVYVQSPTGNVPAPDGNYELAFWHDTDTYELTVSQTLTDVPRGTYELTGYFTRGANMVVTMFARGCSDEDPEPKEVPQTDPNSFTLYTLRGIEVDRDSCEVGITVSAGPNDWMNVDLLAFTKE